jgi:hypothetical protein
MQLVFVVIYPCITFNRNLVVYFTFCGTVYEFFLRMLFD